MHRQGSKLQLARDNFEGKKSHGCQSWGVIVTTIPSAVELYLLSGVLQKADQLINIASLFIGIILFAVASGK